MGKLPFGNQVKKEFDDSLEKEKEKALANPFSIVNNLYVTKRRDLIDIHSTCNKITPFILNRFIAADKACLKFAYAMSGCQQMPLKQLLLFYYYTIHQKKKHSIPYYNNIDKLYQKRLDYICKVFQCNKIRAAEYYRLFSEEQLVQITENYKVTIKKEEGEEINEQEEE